MTCIFGRSSSYAHMFMFSHSLILTTKRVSDRIGACALAAQLGDEGVHWNIRDLGGRRYAFRFAKAGHAALFRAGMTRRGHSIDS